MSVITVSQTHPEPVTFKKLDFCTALYSQSYNASIGIFFARQRGGINLYVQIIYGAKNYIETRRKIYQLVLDKQE